MLVVLKSPRLVAVFVLSEIRSPSSVLPSFVIIIIIFVVAKSSRFRFFPIDDSIDGDIEDDEKRASIIKTERNNNVQHRAKQSTLITLKLLLLLMMMASLALLPVGPLNEIVTPNKFGEKSSLREERLCFRAFHDGHILQRKSPTLTSSSGENRCALILR